MRHLSKHGIGVICRLAIAMLMAAVLLSSDLYAQDYNIKLDEMSFKPVNTDPLTGLAIDKIGLDRSKRPCARLKIHLSRMTPEEISGLTVVPIGGNVMVMKSVIAYEGNGLIVELTANEQVRLYLKHPDHGESNIVSLALAPDTEYRMEACLAERLTLALLCENIGAKVYVDDKYAGEVPQDGVMNVPRVLVGRHDIRIEDINGSKAVKEIYLSSGNVTFKVGKEDFVYPHKPSPDRPVPVPAEEPTSVSKPSPAPPVRTEEPMIMSKPLTSIKKSDFRRRLSYTEYQIGVAVDFDIWSYTYSYAVPRVEFRVGSMNNRYGFSAGLMYRRVTGWNNDDSVPISVDLGSYNGHSMKPFLKGNLPHLVADQICLPVMVRRNFSEYPGFFIGLGASVNYNVDGKYKRSLKRLSGESYTYDKFRNPQALLVNRFNCSSFAKIGIGEEEWECAIYVRYDITPVFNIKTIDTDILYNETSLINFYQTYAPIRKQVASKFAIGVSFTYSFTL